MQPSERDRVLEAAEEVRSRSRLGPIRAGLVLGSGLGAVAEQLSDPVVLDCRSLPHFPTPSVAGHEGRLWMGRWAGAAVAVLQGRVHLYEGYSSAEVVFGVRVLVALGAESVCLTNAAGGIREDLAPGDLMRIEDHLNLTGHSPLLGPNDDRWGPRFPDLGGAYDPTLGRALDRAASQAGVGLKAGVYCQLLGPSYETPAEVRMLQRLGADAVGMSTVQEVLALRHQGVRVAAISCISNRAAGLDREPLSHEAVSAAAAQGAGTLARLLEAFIPLAVGSASGPPVP
jgi:purine-nucleoside phosphorylase